MGKHENKRECKRRVETEGGGSGGGTGRWHDREGGAEKHGGSAPVKTGHCPTLLSRLFHDSIAGMLMNDKVGRTPPWLLPPGVLGVLPPGGCQLANPNCQLH